MTGGAAPGLRARHVVAATDARGRGAVPGGARRGGRLRGHPTPLRFAARSLYSKDDVFGVCDALARAERALTRAGEPEEAARLAAAFDVLESGLVRSGRPLVSRETARTRSPGN